ncbi:MAG: alpha/beta hydrolase [Actinobacteria bacterium]|nr:alpha/beta hydrolase [Actinomycetota bacterium]
MLVGHSMGGLVSQLTMQRIRVAAVVAISSAAPRGVLSTKPSFLKANWGHITPFRSKRRPVRMSFRRFQYAFANNLPEPEQRAAYERYVVPESRRVPAGALTSAAKVDYSRPHPPLLFVSGSDDNVIPVSLVRANAKRYQRSANDPDLAEMPGRNHLLIAQDGWEDVADEVLDWLERMGV